MNFIHGINEEYEWKILLGILIFSFSVLIISVSIFPVLRTTQSIILEETKKGDVILQKRSPGLTKMP